MGKKDSEVSMESAIVEYPCEWSFRLIGSDAQLIRKAVEEYMRDSTYTLLPSNTSSSGKYVSLNLETVVSDENARNQIYEDLKKIPSLKMVL